MREMEQKGQAGLKLLNTQGFRDMEVTVSCTGAACMEGRGKEEIETASGVRAGDPEIIRHARKQG